MRIVEIIECKRWKNVLTGRTASIYGSLPYWSDSDAKNWTVETCGFTWVLDNGTIGMGRVPAKTMEEAVEVMNRVNARCNAKTERTV